MSYSVRGPSSGKKYVFKKGVKTPVHPSDYHYFEALPQLFEMHGPGSEDRKGRSVVPLSHTTLKREYTKGQSIPQLEALSKFRQRKRAEKAQARADFMNARKQQSNQATEIEVAELREKNRLLREREAKRLAEEAKADDVAADAEARAKAKAPSKKKVTTTKTAATKKKKAAPKKKATATKKAATTKKASKAKKTAAS